MKVVLGNLDRRWLAAASRELCQNLSMLFDAPPFSAVEDILAWTSFFPGEVDLTPFITAQLGARRVFLPRVVDGSVMNFISIGSEWSKVMQAGAFGIPEPQEAHGQPFDLDRMEKTVVIVPALAFDRAGNRLGRGKGHYDRFLGQRKLSGVLKLGVGWSLQVVDSIPVHSHDVPMDWLCTEQGSMRLEVA